MKDGRFLSILAGILFVTSFAVYSFTSARSLVNIADSSELLTAAYGGGVAHPPAYPLYTAFLHLILQLPDNFNPVFLTHLSSGFFQSAALVFFFLTSVILTKRRDVSFLGTATLAFSQLFWNQATYAEVFSLLLFFVSLIVWMIVSKKNLTWISLVLGIAASHHQLIVCLIPGLVWIYRKKSKTPWMTCVGLFLIGLCIPYLWLVVANHQAPLSWRVDPGIMGFVDVLLRSIYTGVPPIVITWPARLRSVYILVLSSFTSLGWVAAVFGVVGIMGSKKLVLPLRQFLFITLILSGPVLLGYMVFLDPTWVSLEMHAYNTYLTLRMTLIFQYLFALLIPLGLSWFLDATCAKKYWFLNVILYGVIIVSTIFSFIHNYPIVSKRNEWFAEHLYSEVLRFLPSDSVLLVDSDDAFGLLAVQTIRHTRPDVLIIPTAMQMRWGYLQQVLPADIFSVSGYYQLILSLAQWSELQNMALFVYQPKQIFIQQMETYGYVLSPYGYALRISRTPEMSPEYSYTPSSQLFAGSYSKNDMWSIFERKQLANLHENLSVAYAKNGQIDQSKKQLQFSKQLIDSVDVFSK